MLAPHIEAEVEWLLAAGVSQRRTAKLLEIGRGTVNHIATGARPANLSRHKAEELDGWSPATRCCVCGRKMHFVHGHCRACAAESPRVFELVFTFLPHIGLALRPADQTRYLEVRAARELTGPPVDPDPLEPLVPDSPPDRDTPPSLADLVAIEAETA